MALPCASQIVCNNKWWLANGDGGGLSVVEVIQNERYPIERVILCAFRFRVTPQGEGFWWDTYHNLQKRGYYPRFAPNKKQNYENIIYQRNKVSLVFADGGKQSCTVRRKVYRR